MDSILVLGMNGFTGKHFQRYILKNGLLNQYKFIGVDITIDNGGEFEGITADLSKEGSIEHIILLKKPEYILNLTGSFGTERYHDMFEVNAELSRRILAVLAENNLNVKKVVLIGSAAEYGLPVRMPVKETHPLNPISQYGLSKVIQTCYANYYFRNHGINVVIARTFNILGKGLSSKLSIGSFAAQIKTLQPGGIIKVGNVNTTRDFIAIEDTVDAYWKIMQSGKPGETYNVCSGKSMSIKHILEFMIKQSQKRLIIKEDEKLVRKNDILDFFGDNIKLKSDTNWEIQKNVYESLKEMIL